MPNISFRLIHGRQTIHNQSQSIASSNRTPLFTVRPDIRDNVAHHDSRIHSQSRVR